MSITLRGAVFSSVWDAAGVSNFHRQFYWFHYPLKPFGHSFTGATPVSKTSTLPLRPGNMPLKDDGVTPKELFPKCIYVDILNELALNAVSLSGPGFDRLCSMGLWQRFTEAFQISLMSLAQIPAERKAEMEENLHLASRLFHQCQAPMGIQQNISCPNGGLDPESILDETLPMLDIAERILPRRIPYIVKVGPDCHPKAAKKIADHPRCDALCALNTLGFGKHPVCATETEPVDWKKLFGTDDPKQSPIAKHFPGFPGGLSGAPLRPFTIEWLRKVRALGVRKHINVCSQLTREHLIEAKAAGADSVSVGSLSFLKPLGVRSFIRDALHIFD